MGLEQELKKHLKNQRGSTNLENAILARISIADKRAKRIRLAAFSLTAVISFSSLIFSAMIFGEAAAQSGFYNYTLILFQDTDMALAYWREFSLLVAESLPITSLAIALSATVIFLWSALKTITKVKTLKTYKFA